MGMSLISSLANMVIEFDTNTILLFFLLNLLLSKKFTILKQMFPNFIYFSPSAREGMSFKAHRLASYLAWRRRSVLIGRPSEYGN